MIVRQLARPYGRALTSWRTAKARQACLRVRSYANEANTTGHVEESTSNSSSQSGSIDSLLSTSSFAQGSGFSGQQPQHIDPEVVKISQKHSLLQHSRETFGGYGGVATKAFNPNHVLINPPSPAELTPELLLASQTHLGHSTSLWNPMNSRFIYGIRDGIHIIALEETLAHLRRACHVVRGISERAGLVLFVGTRPGQQDSVVKAAQLGEGYHLFERWVAGSITNGNQILGGLKKKIVDMHDERIAVNEDSLKSVGALKPDLVVCLNPRENWVLLNECALHNVPTIGIIDTDADPTHVTYPIPGNDDSIRCTNLIAAVLGRAAQEGNASRRALAQEGKVLYEPLKLPANTVLGEAHKVVLETDGVPVEYVDEDGRVMSPEEIKNLQSQGALVDRSLMTFYKDGDGGDMHADVVYRFDETTGDMITELTKAGGGDYDPMSPPPPEVSEEPDVQSSSSADGAAVPKIGSVVKDDAAAEDVNLELVEDAALKEYKADLAADSPIDVERAEKEDEAIADLEEKDRIEAAKPKPDDKRQARLDAEKRERSH